MTTQLTFPISKNCDPEPIENLLITTKAYDVQRALAQVSHRLTASCNIIVLVNGIGYMEAIQLAHPNLRFILGATTEGAYRVNENKICHAGEGLTRIGFPRQIDPPMWFESWLHIDLPILWETEIDKFLWQKLAVNCAINPISAIHRCKNGELSARQDLASQVLELCEEISLVSRLAGYVDTAKNIHEWVEDVIEATAENHSSMLQDVLARRPSEIEFITGYFVRKAENLEIETPANTRVLNAVLALESAYQAT